jgi:hypothetical protein
LKRLWIFIGALLIASAARGSDIIRQNAGTLSNSDILFFWNPESNTQGQSAGYPTSSTISFTTAGSSWAVTAATDAYLGTYSLSNRNGGSKRIHIPTMTPTGINVVNFAEGALGHAYQIRESPLSMDGEMFWSTNTTGARWMPGIKIGANPFSFQYVNLSTGIVETSVHLTSGTWRYAVWRWDFDGDKLGFAGCQLEIDGVVVASSAGVSGVIPTAHRDATTNDVEISVGGFDGNAIHFFLDAVRISSDPRKDLYSRRFSLSP